MIKIREQTLMRVNKMFEPQNKSHRKHNSKAHARSFVKYVSESSGEVTFRKINGAGSTDTLFRADRNRINYENTKRSKFAPIYDLDETRKSTHMRTRSQNKPVHDIISNDIQRLSNFYQDPGCSVQSRTKPKKKIRLIRTSFSSK